MDKLRDDKEDEKTALRFVEEDFKGDELDSDMPKGSIISIFSIPAEGKKDE